jgi:hypothetical protein
VSDTIPPSGDQNNYLPINTKLRHRVNDTEESRDSLRLLSNLGLVHFQLETIVLEVPLHLLSVHIVDVLVRDGEASLPLLVAVCEIGVLGVEDAVDEREVVFDLLVAFDVEAGVAGVGGRLLDGGFEV